MFVRPSTLRRWSYSLLLGFTDPYNHTYSESLWWKLLKNPKRTQIQRQRQWQRQRQRQWQRQRQRHRQSTWKTQHMLYFWNPDDLLIPNIMIDTSPWSSCSRQSPWLPCFGHRISSTGPSVSSFRDFWAASRPLHFPASAVLPKHLVLVSPSAAPQPLPIIMRWAKLCVKGFACPYIWQIFPFVIHISDLWFLYRLSNKLSSLWAMLLPTPLSSSTPRPQSHLRNGPRLCDSHSLGEVQ